jgi:uncharacterized protein YndB with AHSA1/START domain
VEALRRTTLVRSSAVHTFDVFTGRLAEWWPRVPYSLGGDRVVDVTLDGRVGGRVCECWDDGTTRTWGHVTAWERPARFAMTWEVFGAPTEVELRFRVLGPALTRVELEHRGWERLSEAEQAEAQQAAGGYGAGWETILAALRDRAELGG